jgi:hypothetical protein
MGTTTQIDADTYPAQGDYNGRRVQVCYNYDTARTVDGTVIRDDKTAPWLTIIRTDDGRTVLSTECQWSPIDSSTGIIRGQRS